MITIGRFIVLGCLALAVGCGRGGSAKPDVTSLATPAAGRNAASADSVAAAPIVTATATPAEPSEPAAPQEVPTITDQAAPVADQPDRAARKKPYPPEQPINTKAPSLKIAFISYANPQQVVKDSRPVVAYLRRFAGVEVEGFVTNDYGASIEAMRGDKADMAFVDPLAFMMAHEQIGAKPLVLEVYSNGKPSYHSSIWVRKDSGIRSVADLKGKSIAFADQVDMSGHLLPREVFVRDGLVGATLVEGDFFKQTYFAGGDEQAVRAVLNQFVDAAGVSQYAELLLHPEERAQMATIANSIESPSHLLMVRKGLDDAVAERVKAALLALDYSDPTDKEVLDKLYGVRGYVPAELSQFAEVAKIAARYGFVKNPQAFAVNAQ